MKKILILALGDKYWTKFAVDFSLRLAAANIPSVVAMESRVGEYQLYFRRMNYAADQTYYLTDFVNSTACNNTEDWNIDNTLPKASFMGDYLRLSLLRAESTLAGMDWDKVFHCIPAFIEYILSQHDIAAVFHDQVSTTLSFVCCEMARDKNIPYYGMVSARIPGRYETRRTVASESEAVASIYRSITEESQDVSELEKSWATSYLENINQMVPDYMRSGSLNDLSYSKVLNSKNIKLMLGTLYYVQKEKEDMHGLLLRESPMKAALRSASRNIMRRVRKPYVEHLLETLEDSWLKSHKYFVYPIHYQPEASTVMGGPFYADQLNTLTNLAFALPCDSVLVVKEHISNVGFPRVEFYKKIKSLPHVKMVSHKMNIKNLIRYSQGLITLTSTAGYEALLLDKPVFLFGDVFYEFHPLCIKLDGWNDVEKSLREWPVKAASHKYDNMAFLVAYRRYTREGKLDFEEKEFAVGPRLEEIIKNEVYNEISL